MRPMELKKGIAVSPGIVIREAFILDSEEIRIPQRFIEKEQIEEEAARFEQAIRDAEKRLDSEIKDLGSQIQINTQILQIHRELLGDPVLKTEILTGIQENQYTAEHSVSRVLNKYIKKFERMDSQIISERVHDLYDVEKLILTTLLGAKVEHLDSLEREVVLVARNLTPARTAKLDATWVKGFATDIGGKTSHTAIMAKALGIPAVVGLENISTTVVGGDTLIIDGFRGVVMVNPDARTLSEYRDKEKNLVKHRQRLRKETALPSETVDGYPIELYANIELVKEVHALANLNTAGIGLFRTEFIHLQNPRSGEEGHFQHYQATLKEVGQLPVTFRTLDLGADKGDGGRGQWVEENPFLGCRSIRYCFAHPELFRDQLRALFRASALGQVRIMLPMISSISELDRALHIIDQVKEDLRNDNVSFDEGVPLGVMVEIPALAMIADLVAPRVDFFSVGTNDLTQYTLAVDRGNENVAPLFDPGHPAVLRLLRRTLHAGEQAGIPVSLCGEMASEPIYVPLLLGLGFRNLSVSPTSIPEVKRLLRSIKIYECKALAKRCLAHSDGFAINAELRDWARDKLPQEY